MFIHLKHHQLIGIDFPNYHHLRFYSLGVTAPRCSKGFVLVYSLTLLEIVTDHHLVVCLELLSCEFINQKLNIYNSNGVKCAHVSSLVFDFNKNH